MNKRVLLTGGYGFLGRAAATCFAKEGWDVYIIDDKTSEPMEPLRAKHRLYPYSVIDERCEDVFRVHNFDVVLHLAERTTSMYSGEYLENAGVNFPGLAYMMALSTKYHVGKFFLISTGSVFTAETKDTGTDGETAGNLRAMQKYVQEEYARRWGQNFDLDVTVLRLSTVYGPGQLENHGFVAKFVMQALRRKPYELFGSPDETRDFLYIDDAVYAMYRAAERDHASDTINVSSGKAVSYAEFEQCAAGVFEVRPTRLLGTPENAAQSFGRAILDNTECVTELGWRMNVPLAEGLRRTYDWYQNYLREKEKRDAAAQQADRRKVLWHRILPYLEHAGLFAAAAGIVLWQGNTVNSMIRMDFNYIYIAVLGLLYGKQHSLPAVGLSCLLLGYSLLIGGTDVISLLYLPEYLLHFASYLFVGVLTGYITDTRDRELEGERYKCTRTLERYDFLYKMYQESISIKDKLYRQITNSNDSIGRVYRIVKRLDSVEPENVFTQAVAVTAEIMEAENVVLYVKGSNPWYFRQKIRRGPAVEELPRSLKVEATPYLRDMIADKRLFVNRQLEEGMPDIAAPIVYEDEVIAVVELHALDFDLWTFYRQNLLSMTARLIATAIGHAYFYEQAVQEKRFIPGTQRILREEQYRRIVEELEERAAAPQTAMSLVYLNIGVAHRDWQALESKLTGVVRAEDYIGQVGNVAQIVLTDVNDEVVAMVQSRLKEKGIASVRAAHMQVAS